MHATRGRTLRTFAVFGIAVWLSTHQNPVAGEDKTYQNLTLDQCIEIALAEYPPLKNQRESLLAAESAYRAARGDFLPVLYIDAAQDFGQEIPSTGEQRSTFAAASVEKSFEYGGSLSVVGQGERDDRYADGEEYASAVSVDFQQPLLEGFGRDVAAANLKIAEINRDIAGMALTDAVRGHILAVTRQYHRVIEAERLLQVRDEALDRARKALRRLEILVTEGEEPRIDIATQELQVAGFEENFTQATNSLRDAKIQLRFLMGVDPEREVTLAPSPELEIDFKPDKPTFTPRPLDMEKLKRKALERRLDYLEQKRALENREIAVLVAKNVLLPELGFFASLGLADSGSSVSRAFHLKEGDWVTGLQFSVPFGLVREREQYTQARIALRQAQNSLEQTRRRVLNQVDNSVRFVQTLELRLQSAYRAVKNAQLSEAGAAERYDLGLMSIFDRAESQAKLTDAEASYVSLFLSYKDALAELDFTTGEPVEQRYGVNL
jgi:outer membrane protein TolC